MLIEKGDKRFAVGGRFAMTVVLNLWLVDDNEEFREGFCALLRRNFGFERMQQFDSAEAMLAALEVAVAPDVVLLDLKLPKLNGAEVVKLIKAKSPQTRVFIFATFFDVLKARQAQAAGASGYFTKNQIYDDVVAAICAG